MDHVLMLDEHVVTTRRGHGEGACALLAGAMQCITPPGKWLVP
jgi:hypothetical protein